MIRVVESIKSIGMVRRRLDACPLDCILGRVLARMGDAGTLFFSSIFFPFHFSNSDCGGDCGEWLSVIVGSNCGIIRLAMGLQKWNVGVNAIV